MHIQLRVSCEFVVAFVYKEGCCFAVNHRPRVNLSCAVAILDDKFLVACV